MNDLNGTPEQELLSLEAAAEFLCVSKSTLYRLLGQEKLRGMKAGKQWRFRKGDLVDYMQRGPAALALDNLPIQVLEGELAALAEALSAAGAATEESDDPALVGEAGKIRQLVRRMAWLLRALGGSDIHLEPAWEAGAGYVRLRLRVDGSLREVRRFPLALAEPLVLAWKQEAGLSLKEQSRPQDGTVHLTFGETLLPLRVSVVPTLYGERVAVRSIPTRVPTLDELGLAESPLKEWIRSPRGLVLSTGPTGSGKATTRAACVQELVGLGINIMAAEDRVEYLFPPEVTQLKVEGFTCAEGARALLLQDPDVVLLSELQGDPALAQAAAQQAEYGHLVIACMHAYDSISALYDLVEAGVKRSLLVGNLIGIANQHLLPALCPKCKKEHAPDPTLLSEIRKRAEEEGYHVPDSAVFYVPAGCEACHEGYTGRRALQESFAFTPALKAGFLRGATREELTRLAHSEGHRSGFALGVQWAAEGITSLEEVMRKLSRG